MNAVSTDVQCTDNLYIVFSSTQCGMGRFVRFMTHNTFNHVSISMDPELQILYSFSRRHESTPFYSGFVQESPLRYKGATVKVCKIPLTHDQTQAVEGYIDRMRGNVYEYIYNLFSAIISLIGKKVRISDSFTCLEFVTDVLDKCRICDNVSSERFCRIQDLEKMLESYVTYIGNSEGLFSCDSWGNDMFAQRVSMGYGLKHSVEMVATLFSRMLKDNNGE